MILDWDHDEALAEFLLEPQVCELYRKYDKFKGFSSVLAQGFCNLKKLNVRHSFIEEIWPHALVDEEGQHIGICNVLRELKLSEMPNLLHLWSENFQLGRTFQNLEHLRVSKCGRLKYLMPSSITFQNLQSLEVSECHGLKYLMPSSTMKCLVQLWRIQITECTRMTEIIADEGGDEISFNPLKYLGIHCLPNLRGFNLSNRTIRFPLLKNVTVTRCPELKIFSNGVLSTPKLKEVELAENNSKYQWGYIPVNQEQLWEGDLNTTIKRFWEDNFATCIQQLFTEKVCSQTFISQSNFVRVNRSKMVHTPSGRNGHYVLGNRNLVIYV